MNEFSMSPAEIQRRMNTAWGAPAGGAPRCTCRHSFYAHGNRSDRVCDWCGCTGFRTRGGQVRLRSMWVET